MSPYRCLAPARNTWIPTAFFALRLPWLFLTAYIVIAGLLWFSRGEIWIWVGLVVTATLHIVLYYVVNRLPFTSLKRLRLRAMRAACIPQQPAGGYGSQAEWHVGLAFEQANVQVYQQQKVDNLYSSGYEYITDFAYFDPSCGLRIDIEVDGSFKQHNADIQQKMATRDDWFVSTGWHVLRFHALDCYHRPQMCVAAVQQYIAETVQEHHATLQHVIGKNWESL